MNHVESTTKIYDTFEYGAFKILKGNREIDKLKIKKIADDIVSGIDILPYNPIIVNSSMEIIDGQHRYHVSKLLKKKVYYTIMPDASLSTVPAINSKSSNWRNIDFLNSYVDLKKEAYIDLKGFLNQYPRVTIPVATGLYYVGSPRADKDVQEDFQQGNLKNSFRANAHKYAFALNELEPYTNNPFSRNFFHVIMHLLDNGKYDHALMIKKLKSSGRRIENVDSSKFIMEEMESIINFKSREKIYIS